jgi:hypothetical protein
MRKLLAIVALFAALSTLSAQAQVLGGNGIWKTVPSVVSGYTGPGDIVSGAYFFGGLRAYNAAYATGANKSMNVRRASDNGTQDILILSTGAFAIATANTFAGTDATASCTIATTVATCTGASSTPHTGSTITGSGLQEPCYATSVGTFTGGAGTVNLGGTGTSPCGTISVAVTLTFQYGLYIAEVYDQSGNGNHLVQATAGEQPQLMPICLNSLPCLMFNSSGGYMLLQDSSAVSVSQPFTYISVAERIGAFTAENGLFSTANSANSFFYTSANTFGVYGGLLPTVTASDSSWHVLQAVFSGASGVLTVDATQATKNTGTIATGGIISMGSFNGNAIDIYLSEGGIWPSALSGANQTAECHNAYLYWATSTSC